MNDSQSVVCQDQEDIRNLKPKSRLGEKSRSRLCFRWLSKKVRHICEGGFGLRAMCLPTLFWSPLLISDKCHNIWGALGLT